MTDWATRARAATPGGSQTRSKANLFPDPVVVTRARAGHAWDADGREYVDWISGLCAITLGAGNEEVDEAVIRQIRDAGVTFPLSTRLEVEVAEQLLGAIGWGEQVRWVKTGSEATAAAMLVARAATGRRKIVSCGYHGWTGGHLPGPELVSLPMMSWAAMEMIDAETAGVLVEVLRDGADHLDVLEWLAEVRDRCREVGALLIMDEIVTGFRWAVGGATEFLELAPPDLACFGKGMASGYALGALVGSRRLMQHAVGVSSTFGGEAVGLAAAQAVIRIYKRDKIIEKLWAIGTNLMNLIPKHSSWPVMTGYPVHPQLKGPPNLAALAAERGVLVIPSGLNPTAAHTEVDIATTVEALRP